MRIAVRGADGGVSGVEALSDTLVPHPATADPAGVRDTLLAVVRRHLERATFPRAPADSRITLPFAFE